MSTPNTDKQAATLRRRWPRWLGVGVLAVLALLAAALFWLLGTGSGLRFALGQATRLTDGALSVKQASGSLAGPTELKGLRYRTADGLDVRVDHARVDIGIWSLLAEHVHVQRLQAGDIRVALPKAAPPKPEQKSTRFSLRAPLNIQIDSAHIGHTEVTQAGQSLFVANSLDLAGKWTAQTAQVRTLKLVTPQGHVSLHGQMGFDSGYPGQLNGDFRWKTGKNTLDGTLTVRSDRRTATLDMALTQPTRTTLSLRLNQAAGDTWTAALEVPRFDPSQLLGPGDIQHLALSLHGHGDGRRGQFNGQITINGTRIDLTPMDLALDKQGNTLSLDPLTVRSPQVPGQLTARGQVHLDTSPISAQLALDWQGVQLPATLAGQRLDTHGKLQVHGTPAQFAAKGDIAIGPPKQLAQVALDISGSPSHIDITTLQVKQPKGELSAHGALDLGTPFGWQLTATAHQFNPGQLFAGWSGALNADLRTHGKLGPDTRQGVLELKKLDGTLRQRKLAGHGTLTLDNQGVVSGELALNSGRSRVHVNAAKGARNRVRMQLQVASLGDWLPDAQGHIDGHIDVSGLWPSLAVRAQLSGNGLVYADQRIKSLHLDAHMPNTQKPGGDIDLRAADAYVGGLHFDTVAISGHGNPSQHSLKLDAKGQPLTLHLALSGSQQAKQWHGRLQTLTLDAQGLPTWRLTQPAAMSWNGKGFSLDQACLSAGSPQLCLAADSQPDGSLKASYRLRALPLALLTTLAGDDLPVRAEGTLNGQGHITRSAKGVLGGQAEIDSDKGSVAYIDHPGQPLLRYSQFKAHADLNAQGQQLRVSANLNDGGHLAGQVTLQGKNNALNGEVQLDLKHLAFVELLSAEVANVKGQLDADLKLAGTLAKPVLGGHAQVQGLGMEIPAAGITLADGQFRVATGDQQQLTVQGHITSGKGQLKVDGQAGLAPGSTATLHVSGEQVTAADIPAARVIISPDLKLSQDKSGLDVTGTLHIDSANVDLNKLPGAGAAQSSPDVVVVDEKQQAQRAQSMPISAKVMVQLGDHTHLKGFGLNGRLYGALRVNEAPGHATTGQGQVQVDGTYRAYGQDLTISQGRLLFAGTPINNPGLDIRAVRKLNPNATIDQGQEVGLQIRGTAQRPIMTVFSNPAMEQSDALSYMITGKPLSQVRGGEGSMVTGAAQALGSAAGDLLAKRVGSRIGIDQIGVSNNDALGGASAFTVGKYLSPRLYLSYGVGLFEPGQVITMRYRLSHRWNIEIENATDFNRASLNYRLEK
ncbi:translocation/assembly module TamB domain-containing protein [Oleiagrimonas sp. C23AA]|uniref:translocation/assembly module TamB domain-containing protein n=1 Tax=Oleiagrimonas sp. C23AA TaxID=2719047 RepID=UPI0031B70B49